MKKIIILAVTLFSFTVIIKAQYGKAYIKEDMGALNKQESIIKKEKKDDRTSLRKLKGSEASAESKAQFLIDFPSATAIQWKRTINFDEATFIKDGTSLTAFYDTEAALVGTTEKKLFSDLPLNAQNSINEKYKAYRAGDVLFYHDNAQNQTDMLLYNLQFPDVDSYFIELKKANRKIVLQVDMDGNITYFTRLN